MAANPFSSDWLAGGRDERLRPQGTLSYVSGSTDEPLRFITLSQQLDKTVSRHGARDAAIFDAENLRLSWYDLQAAAPTSWPPACSRSACAAATASASGRRTGTSGSSRSSRRRGSASILVNINPAYRTTELEYALNKVGCRALVMARRFKASD